MIIVDSGGGGGGGVQPHMLQVSGQQTNRVGRTRCTDPDTLTAPLHCYATQILFVKRDQNVCLQLTSSEVNACMVPFCV